MTDSPCLTAAAPFRRAVCLILFFIQLQYAAYLCSQRLSAAALLIFLSASAGAGIVGVDLLHIPLLRCFYAGVVFVCACHLGRRLSLHLLLYADMEEDADSILTDGGSHALKHLISTHLVFYYRIALAVGLKTDSLTQLVHIIDVSHPLIINHLKKDHALNLTHLLGLGEFCFLCLVKLESLLFEIVHQLLFLHLLHLIRKRNGL